MAYEQANGFAHTAAHIGESEMRESRLEAFGESWGAAGPKTRGEGAGWVADRPLACGLTSCVASASGNSVGECCNKTWVGLWSVAAAGAGALSD
jgi:hypothetical protein